MKTEAGFTLIEVLIAMAILSFGMLSLSGMQVVSIRVNMASNRLTEAATLMQDKIEELMSLPFTHASLADTTPVGTCQSYTESAPPKGYTLVWCVDDDDTGTRKTVNVTATWYNGKQAKSLPLSFSRTTFQSTS
jgi:prepilin-type N-terminal cleavage/methylation domain-containing protein